MSVRYFCEFCKARRNRGEKALTVDKRGSTQQLKGLNKGYLSQKGLVNHLRKYHLAEAAKVLANSEDTNSEPTNSESTFLDILAKAVVDDADMKAIAASSAASRYPSSLLS